ncbi:MAG TPA: hypothetical protein VK993_06610 [Chthoniobacterales bacterium]|nr:hypothetical protein [Chthoniobacterales bacterium]
MMRRFSFLVVAVVLASLALVRGQTPGPSPDSPAATFIPWLMEGKEEMNQVPFSDVILYATGKKVLGINCEDEADQRVLKQVGGALDEVLKRMNAADSPVQSVARINEVSAPFENMIREVLNGVDGFTCDFAKTAVEKVQRSGYPDLQLTDTATKRIYYMDPKLYAKGSRDSSFRSFYFEPKVATNKVRDDAVHLILGIEHDGRQAGHWSFTRWEIVDLAKFKVRLKAEFQGSNRDMYRAEAIVATGAARDE